MISIIQNKTHDDKDNTELIIIIIIITTPSPVTGSDLAGLPFTSCFQIRGVHTLLPTSSEVTGHLLHVREGTL
jgi:hypothetical protein